MNNTTDGLKNQEVIASISINSKQLIAIIKDKDGKPTVNARDLHEFLESKQQFSNWVLNRIEQYGFTQGVDFITINNSIYSPPRTEYHITIDMAKELSMVERNEKGKQARQYFIECEKIALKQPAIPSFVKDITRLDMAKMLLLAEEDREKAEKKVKLLETEKKFNAPKVDAWESFLESDGYFTLRGAFKMLQLPPNISTKILRDEKVLYKLQKTNTPSQKYIDKGYFVMKVNRNEQQNKDFAQTYVTPSGLEWLRGKFDSFVASIKNNQGVTA